MTRLLRILALGGALAVAPAATSGASPLAGGVTQGGASPTIAVVPMGHLSDTANRFFQTFTSKAGGPWTLSTPTGTATNGGIVLASPSANAAAILPFYLLDVTSVRPLVGGDAAGDGQVLPALVRGPSSLSIASDGTVAALTTNGRVLVGPSLAGPFRTVTTLTGLRSTPWGGLCGLRSLTGVAAGPSGTVEVAGSCSKPGVLGLFVRQSPNGTWAARAFSSRFPVTIERLDSSSASTMTAIVTSMRHPQLWAVEAGPTSTTVGVSEPMVGRTLRSTDLVTSSAVGSTSAPSYVVGLALRRSVIALKMVPGSLPVKLGTSLPLATQAIVERGGVATIDARKVSALLVNGSTLTELVLTPSGSRWVSGGVQRVSIPYGTSK